MPLGSNNLLEDDFKEPYQTWKADPSPTNNAMILKTLQPTIDDAIRVHVGPSNPLIVSRARRMALTSLGGYDPNRSRLRTHMYNQLQGLKRVNRQQTSILKVPERVSLDRYALEQHTKELTAELGREPTDHELADKTGFSTRRMTRVRSYNPAVAEGTLEEAGGGGQVFGGGTSPTAERHNMALEIVYGDLQPMDQKIAELSLGLNGRRPLSNQEIARKLGRSPGLISQRKSRIQKSLDEMETMQPMV